MLVRGHTNPAFGALSEAKAYVDRVPQCQKKLKVPDTSAGKKMKCPHCKGIVVRADRRSRRGSQAGCEKAACRAIDELAEDVPQEKAKLAREADDNGHVAEGTPKKKATKRPPPDEPEADDADPDALRCAKCNSAALKKLPPNAFSRNPGFECKKCKAIMRPPGSTVVYLFAMLMGGLVFLIGIAILLGVVVMLVMGENVSAKGFGGAGILSMLGAVTAGWGFSQIRLPTPRNAPPFRWGLWIGILLVVVLVVALVGGGCVFGFM